MMNNYTLPTSIIIDDRPFGIRDKGDFRMVLSCFNIMSNVELTSQERLYACLLVFYEDFYDLDDLLEYTEIINELSRNMVWFLDCGQDFESARKMPKLVDWDRDSVLICSAINSIAGKEVRAEKYIHWWTFIGYYMAIGECSLSNIMGIRYKIAKSEKLEKHEKKFVYENPQYFNIDYRTSEQKEAEDFIQGLWKGGQ